MVIFVDSFMYTHPNCFTYWIFGHNNAVPCRLKVMLFIKPYFEQAMEFVKL